MVNENESMHPVLEGFKERIAELEKSLLNEQQLRRETFISKLKFNERVKDVLVEAWEDYDQDTIKHIAEQLDIALTFKKQYEVNVTFSIEIEHEIGEEVDPEWDFDFSVSHDAIVDYSSDVIYTNVQ